MNAQHTLMAKYYIYLYFRKKAASRYVLQMVSYEVIEAVKWQKYVHFNKVIFASTQVLKKQQKQLKLFVTYCNADGFMVCIQQQLLSLLVYSIL